jgi:WD40 repeat protein
VTATEAVVTPRDCPYFGLDYYTESFGSWFVGREAERGLIITNLQAARLTLLHAESGVGKTSLLRAGVAWRLRQLVDDGLARGGAAVDIPIVFSAWKDDPVPELITEIGVAAEPFLAGRQFAAPPDGHLDTAIEAAAEATGASLLVILDQFEEYFLYCAREPTPQHFADELARCINKAGLPANFLIAIREDAYAGLGDLFQGRIANVYGNYLHVEYLDRSAAERAIREPLQVYNSQPGVGEPIAIQDDLVRAVLDGVRAYDGDGRLGAADNGDGRVATPLLQLVMATIWDRERAEDSRELRLSTLERLEGVRKVVDTHLEKALAELSSGDRATAVDVFDHLVTPSGGKIAESVPDLAIRTGHTEQQVGDVLEKLDRARIVRPVPAPPRQDPVRFRRYEIFHDVLAPSINRAIAARDAQRRVRRLRRLAALAVGLLVVVTAIGLLLGSLYATAKNEEKVAQSGQLATTAVGDITANPELSTLLALQALHVHYTSQAEAALREALPEMQELRGFDSGTPVLSAQFDPADANKVVSAGQDGDAWIWNVQTDRRVLRLHPRGGFKVNGTADTVAFNKAGTQVAVGYGGGTLAVFDADSGNELRAQSMGSLVNDVRFVGDAGQLAVATTDGAWLGTPGSAWRALLSRGLFGPSPLLSVESVNAVAVDPADATKFAVAGTDGTAICTLRRSGGPRCQRLMPDDFDSSDAEFSPNGSELVTANNDGSLRLYNVDVPSLPQMRLFEALEANATSAQFSPNGSLIVAGYSNGLASVWNAASGLQVTQLAGNSARVNTARFDATGNEIVTAGSDGTIRVWRTLPAELQVEFNSSRPGATPGAVYGAEYSPSGNRLLIHGPTGTYVYTTGGHLVKTLLAKYDLNSARFSPSGAKIVGTIGPLVIQWNGARLLLSPPLIDLGKNITALNAYLSPNGSRLLVITSAETAEVRSSDTGKLLHTLDPGNHFKMFTAAFSPDGSRILTASGGQVQVWNATTGREIRSLGKIGPAIMDLEFNRHGSEFVTAANNGDLTIWAARGYRRLLTINSCPSPTTASFSPNGKLIVAACGNGTARVFDAASGQLLTVISVAGGGIVNTAEFSPDGRSIVTALGAGTGGITTGEVEVWNAQLATSPLAALERLAQQRVNSAFTPAQRAAYLHGASG